jgi:DNA-binding response OmpR family regulator
MAGSNKNPFAIAAAEAAARESALAPRPPLIENRPILVVEDEVIIGLGLMATLEIAGFETVGPAVSVDTAMELLDQHDCALAILDINLGFGETSEALAERLRDEGIPFLVTSAYAPEDRPDIFNHAPNFAKPIGARMIVSAVQAALG